MTELPPARPLPDIIRDNARMKITEGLDAKRPRWRAPVAIAAAVVTFAAGAVFVGQYVTGTTQFAAPPMEKLPPQFDANPVHTPYQPTVEDLARCGDRPVLAATQAIGIKLIALNEPQGRVFCTLTATTVTVSAPTKDELNGRPARILFTAPNGAFAGLVPEGVRHLSLVRGDVSAIAYLKDGLFLAPAGFVDAGQGLRFLVDGDEVVSDDVPAPTPATTDVHIPPAERTSDAGKRLGDCLTGQERGIPDPAQFAPGAYLKLSESSAVQLGVFGELLAVCRVRDVVPPNPRQRTLISDATGPLPTKMISGRWHWFDFTAGTQGETSSSTRAFVGRICDERVASITLVRPGLDDQVAEIGNGTFIIAGPVPNDGARIIVRDAAGTVLEDVNVQV